MALFQKGNRANPGGRPKIAKILAELGEEAGHLRKEMFERIIAIVKAGPKGTNDATWRYACDWLGAHLGIKPKDTIVHEFGGSESEDELDFENMSDDELDAIIAAAEDKEPAPDGGGNPAVH